MKEEFLSYIGPTDSLRGYTRSYKLVFFKSFFELLGEGTMVLTNEVTERFKQYYIQRKQSGHEPDIDASTAIQDVENSSLDSVYRLILRYPFAVIERHGYMSKISRDGKNYFAINETLRKELAPEDIQNILNVVNQKLAFYFSKIDNDQPSGTPLRDMITKILNDYVPAKSEDFAGNSLGVYFRKEIPQLLYNTGIVDQDTYLVSGSIGQGTWATIPWICIFDRSITTSATKGEYIVYLLSADGNSLYLTFNQGCTEIRKTHSKRETIAIMRKKAANIVAKIDGRGFRSDEDIDLGTGLTELGELYQNGTIFYKEYKAEQVPDESKLRQDLINMIAIYQDYMESLDTPGPDVLQRGGEESLEVKETIEHIKDYIAAKGFTYEDGAIENFYLSLKSKPFVILAGISGTGKTRLVRLFAEAVGATVTNGRYKMVSVRPDWSDSSDLFGHVNLNGEFVSGAIIDFVKIAEEDIENPYFLCLDEMNLARVEYYLSDILSVIETREMDADGRIVSDPLIPKSYYGKDSEAAEKYGVLTFPENLYIIGTVNMDETTFPFSRKVLDRANTIEFSHVDLIPTVKTRDEAEFSAAVVRNDFLKTEYLLLSHCTDDLDAVTEYCIQLQQINEILQPAGAHVGYRVRDEIVFYMLNNKGSGLLDEDSAFDNALIQKILPRIQGSSNSVKEMLCELFKISAGDYDGYQTQSDDISSKMLKALSGPHCRYKRSAEKIAFMVRRFEEDGFTSYWL